LRDLMGMLCAAAVDIAMALFWLSPAFGCSSGENEMPAGVAASSEKMKSSIFMGSELMLGTFSDDLRSCCAMPLGVF
jgi:hypothetical protein